MRESFPKDRWATLGQMPSVREELAQRGMALTRYPDRDLNTAADRAKQSVPGVEVLFQ
jgi:hypothetical protein